jgi:L-fuculose-phosphate aldolase
MSQERIREEIVAICRELHKRDFIAAADGNISYRVSDREILITPTQKHKGFITPNDIAVISIENEILSGNPSGERLMHLAVYRKVPEAKCVVHAHPPTAIAWSVAKPELKELPSDSLSEVILAVGKVPIVPYARPGTEGMGRACENFLPENRVMILSRHGALSWGEDLMEAYGGMERIEAIAKILKASLELGGITSLPQSEIEFLRDLRRKIGPKTL